MRFKILLLIILLNVAGVMGYLNKNKIPINLIQKPIAAPTAMPIVVDVTATEYIINGHADPELIELLNQQQSPTSDGNQQPTRDCNLNCVSA